MFHISHSDSSVLSPNPTQVSGWVKKAVVSADVDVKLLTGSMLLKNEQKPSYHTLYIIVAVYSLTAKGFKCLCI